MRHPTSSKFNLTSAYALAICMLLLAPFSANAALTISSTRIIQPSDRQSTSIVVANPSNRAYAAQAWINTEADDSTTAVPLIASPALFRIDPGSEQTVQLNRLPNDLPKDRESLFFFNLQEIPQANDKPDNVLNIALRTPVREVNFTSSATQTTAPGSPPITPTPTSTPTPTPTPSPRLVSDGPSTSAGLRAENATKAAARTGTRAPAPPGTGLGDLTLLDEHNNFFFGKMKNGKYGVGRLG